MRTDLTNSPSKRATQRGKFAALALLHMLSIGLSAMLPAQPLASGKGQQASHAVAVR